MSSSGDRTPPQQKQQQQQSDRGIIWNLTAEQESKLEEREEERGKTVTSDNMTNPSWSGILSHVPKNLLGDPRMVLRHVRKFITVEPVPQAEILNPSPAAQNLLPPKPDGHLRLVCISDTHTHHGRIPQLPPGDVLIHGGDFTDIGMPKDIDAFCSWLEKQTQLKHKIVIAGNHDLSLDHESYPETWRRFGHPRQFDVDEQVAKIRKVSTFLEHEGCEIDGVRFFGSPYQPWFYDWAFNLQRVNECRRMWESLPRPPPPVQAAGGSASIAGRSSPPPSGGSNTKIAGGGENGESDPPTTTVPSSGPPFPAGCAVDVLITHGPPLGHGDMVRGGSHAGCIDLLDYVEAYPPKVHIFGHIHEGYGLTRNDKGTVFINASTMNVHYDADNLNPAVVWDVPIPNWEERKRKIQKAENDGK